MDTYDAEAWMRFGKDVKKARRDLGHRKMPEWGLLVGRSTRILLGLERGEPVGDETLYLVEKALGWPFGEAGRRLAGAVTPVEDDAAFVRLRGDARDTEIPRSDVLGLYREMQADIQRMNARLEELGRLARGENSVDGAESVERSP